MTINEILTLNKEIYGPIDSQLAIIDDFHYYQEKYLLRFFACEDDKSGKSLNLCVALFWHLGFVHRFYINLEMELKRRYPYKCPFCLDLPCSCLEEKNRAGKKTGRPISRFPSNLHELQTMTKKIYPNREINKIKVIDELHKLSFQCHEFTRKPSVSRLNNIKPVTADLFILYLMLANANNIDLTKEIKILFSNGCYLCHKKPCQCYYTE